MNIYVQNESIFGLKDNESILPEIVCSISLAYYTKYIILHPYLFHNSQSNLSSNNLSNLRELSIVEAQSLECAQILLRQDYNNIFLMGR
jgi:hypothetical protein